MNFGNVVSSGSHKTIMISATPEREVRQELYQINHIRKSQAGCRAFLLPKGFRRIRIMLILKKLNNLESNSQKILCLRVHINLIYKIKFV